MSPAFAAFADNEHHERLARARAALRDSGFDGCVSVAPETHFYLAGYDAWVAVNSPQALVFSAKDEREPTLVLRDCDRPMADETTWLSDIRSYRLNAEDHCALIAEVAAEHGLASGRIAVETQSYAITYAYGRDLAEALAPAEIDDGTAVLGGLRLLKSPAEMAYIRDAALFAELGLETARRRLRPGITEIALAGTVEGAMRVAGCDYWAIPTELAAGPRGTAMHATPRDRAILSGELVHMEFAGVARRYHAVALHTVALGKPSSRARDLYAATCESLAAGIAAIRPGAPVCDVEEACLAPLRRDGIADGFKMRFGYGIGIAYPPIWLESLQISRDFDTRLEPGMVFVLHAGVDLMDEGLGVVQGGTYALTDAGLEQLVGGGDVALEVIGA
ncbi:MAG: Xaa-Pro peptidase family protein [Proteobacteria bacterium]|nr:Xaa-Pro peptidase family protein [Pseudomonadota bacterium]